MTYSQPDAPAPPPRAPAGLAARGRRFWRETVAEFELAPTELAILTEVCRTMDNLDALEKSIRENGPMAVGSQGQPVVNPALTEVRGHRLALHRLLAALRLPDDDGEVLDSARTTAARTGATARWSGNLKVVE